MPQCFVMVLLNSGRAIKINRGSLFTIKSSAVFECNDSLTNVPVIMQRPEMQCIKCQLKWVSLWGDYVNFHSSTYLLRVVHSFCFLLISLFVFFLMFIYLFISFFFKSCYPIYASQGCRWLIFIQRKMWCECEGNILTIRNFPFDSCFLFHSNLSPFLL